MSQTQTLVINLSRDTTLQVDVRNKEGELDRIQIVPKGRTHMREEFTIDERWLSQHRHLVRIVKPQVNNTSTLTPVTVPDVGGTE